MQWRDIVYKRWVRCLAKKSVGKFELENDGKTSFERVRKRISHGLGLDMTFIRLLE